MREPLKWPTLPYKGLNYFEREDRLLLAGREADVASCMQRLGLQSTPALLLYGRTGAGKSSFLRAGLIPALEEQEIPYVFLAERADRQSPFAPVFIRCTDKPLERIAQRVFHFIKDPYFGPTASAQQPDLADAALECDSEVEFVKKCQEPGNLIRSLLALSSRLPATLIIILDQAEEVLTQTRPGDPQRQRFFRFLNEFVIEHIDIKLLIALRSEHLGPFEDLITVGGSSSYDVRRFELKELDDDQMLAAMLRPADNDPTPVKAARPPPYNFSFMVDAAKELIAQLKRARATGGALPVMQLVCKDLYGKLAPDNRVIDPDLLTARGGVAGRLSKHIEGAIRFAIGKDARPAEIERWQNVLLQFVDSASDGSATTRILPEVQVHKLLDAQKIPSTGRSEVIDVLLHPEFLVLRPFRVLNELTGDNELRYSLGHDALALGLLNWSAKRAETKRRQEAVRQLREERRASERARFLSIAATALTVVVSLATAWWYEDGQVRQAEAFGTKTVSTFKTSSSVGIAVAVEAIAKLQALDPIARVLFGGRVRSAAGLLEQVYFGLPTTVDTEAMDTTKLVLSGEHAIIIAKGSVSMGDPRDLANAKVIYPNALVYPEPDAYYRAREIADQVVLAAGTNLILAGEGLEPQSFDVASHPFWKATKALEPDATLYLEQDFAQSYGTVEPGGPITSAVLRDDTSLLDVAGSLELTVRPAPNSGIEFGRSSIGVMNYRDGADPVSDGDLFVGHDLVSWDSRNADPDKRLSVFDVFEQNDYFVTPILSKSGFGAQLRLDETSGQLVEVGSLANRRTETNYEGLPSYLARCGTSQGSKNTPWNCTIQTSHTLEPEPFLLLTMFASQENRAPNAEDEGSRLEPAPGCTSTSCWGIIDLATNKFVPGSPQVDFSVFEKASNSPEVLAHRAGDAIQLFIWSAGPKLIVASVGREDGIREFIKWDEDWKNAVLDPADSALLAQSNDGTIYSYSLAGTTNPATLEQIAARFCEDYWRFDPVGLQGKFNEALDLEPSTPIPTGRCPDQRRSSRSEPTGVR